MSEPIDWTKVEAEKLAAWARGDYDKLFSYYRVMISRKIAVLIGCAFVIGAIIGHLL